MSAMLTHVLRRFEAGPGERHYVERLTPWGDIAAMTPDIKDALRLPRKVAQDFQQQTAGWFVAVPMNELISAPRIWGRPQRETLQ